MGKIKDLQQSRREKTKVDAVLDILRKQSPLSLKQEKFCNTACVERFLKVKGESVKKAAKLLRACLTWRDTIGTENLIADEFSGELAEGVAYVAGHDEESRPVMVFRIKQDYQKFHSQKLFTRLVVFTLEVAVQTMSKNVEQFVILFDASFFRSASAFMNIVLPTLKIVADYYPGRLHKAFFIDPPSLFPFLWKGVRPFVELSNLTTIVSSTDFEDSVSLDYNDFSVYPRAASLRFDSSSIPVHSSTAKIGSCASSRFSFTVSHNYDSLKPWYLSLTDSSSSKVGPATITPTTSTSSSILGPNARSFSFASPIARGPPPRGCHISTGDKLLRKNFIPSTPLPQKSQNADVSGVAQPRTPKPSFLHSPAAALFGRRDPPAAPQCKAEKSKEGFLPYFKFYRRPYDEMIYRAKMKPPLGGLISIVAPHQLRRRHMSVSQRF